MANKTFELKEGDDIRELSMTLTSTPLPESAELIISGNGVRLERDLEPDSGKWVYRFDDQDFVDMGVEDKNLTFKMEVYATFEDGTNGTYPTRGTMILKVYPRL